MQRKLVIFQLIVVFLLGFIYSTQARNADLSNYMLNLSGDEPDDAIADDHYPEIIVNGDFVHVVWTARALDWSVNYLYYRRSTDGGETWEDKVTLETVSYDSNYEVAHFRRLAVSGNHVYVISRKRMGNWYYILQLFSSDDNGQTFDAPRTLFTGANAYWVNDIMISSDSNNVSIGFVYIPNWYDAYTLYTLDSDDYGETFATDIAAQNGAHKAYLADIIRAADNVYLLFYHQIENYNYGHWQASIYFAGSADGGQSYPYQHSFTTSASNDEYLAYHLSDENNNPNMAVSGNNVYVIWTQNDTAYDSDDQALYFRRSTDNGENFSSPALIADSASIGSVFQTGQEMIAAAGTNVYIDYMTPAGRIFSRASWDSGQNFQAVQEITSGDTAPDIATGWWPEIAVSPSDTGGATVFQVFSTAYRFSEDAGEHFNGITRLGPVFSWRDSARPKAAFTSDNALNYVVEGACTFYSSGSFGDKDIFYQKVSAWNAPSPGSSNRAMKFTTIPNAGDGSGIEQFDCMEIAASSDVNFKKSMSVEAWINPDVVTSAEAFFIYKTDAGTGSYFLGRSAGGNAEAQILTTDGTFTLVGSEPVLNNEWTHIAMTLDTNVSEDNFKLYVNGVLESQSTASGDLLTGQGILYVGGYSSQRYEDSITIDELRFWNRALSSEEINQDIPGKLTGSESGLTAYYTFDDTTQDITGHGNNGQLGYKETYVDGHVPESPTPTPTPACIHSGDADLSGTVTVGDAQRTFQIALNLYSPTEAEACAADCNGDDHVSAGDAQLVFRYALQMGETCVDSI